MKDDARTAGRSPAAGGQFDRALLAARFRAVRKATERLAAPLSDEDCVLQSMPDASPVKWHLAHTSWFFETFVLEPTVAGFRPFDPEFRVLYNSYYNAVGEQHARPERGLVSRPSLDRVREYRAHVDAGVLSLLSGEATIAQEIYERIELGLHHEQQHQELVLTDVKHLLSRNPLLPAYQGSPGAGSVADSARKPEAFAPETSSERAWLTFAEGLSWIGVDGGVAFSFDNERPRHRIFLEAFEIASRPVTNREYLAFMEDEGYARPELWLSDGWDTVRQRAWACPLYWLGSGKSWREFTLAGCLPLQPEAPVCHISYYEADAFARWAGARLPTEAEWEVASQGVPIEGNFIESGRLHPAPADPAPRGTKPLLQMFGDVWEWTQSPYVPYPRYQPLEGALGEYNGKFMCNQLVLRGGSCATPGSHMRPSYRNFFPPAARWQFSGIRLARDPRSAPTRG